MLTAPSDRLQMVKLEAVCLAARPPKHIDIAAAPAIALEALGLRGVRRRCRWSGGGGGELVSSAPCGGLPSLHSRGRGRLQDGTTQLIVDFSPAVASGASFCAREG